MVEVSVLKVRIKFRKYGALRFIGHLDVMRYFQKVMRRAGIPIAFTGGYSPHMIMSFASPLGIGLESDGEYLDIELTEPISSVRTVQKMNEAGTDGIEVLSVRKISDEKKMTGMTILSASDYKIIPERYCSVLFPDWQNKFTEFMNRKEIKVVKQTKRSERELDIRPLIYKWHFEDSNIIVRVASGSSENLKPELILETFLKFHGLETYNCRNLFQFRRLEMYADTGENGTHKFVTLESMGEEI